MAGNRILVRANGSPLKVGDLVTTFRGEIGVLTGWREPAHSGSTGRVYVSDVGSEYHEYAHEWFPSVIDAHWEEVQ